jgi:Ca2+-dependent lipid-binding protein
MKNLQCLPCDKLSYVCSDLTLKLQGKLTVTIIKAESLKNMEFMSKSDPYVEAYVRPLFKSKTKTISNNLNPKWDETFTFDVEDKETQFLTLKVIIFLLVLVIWSLLLWILREHCNAIKGLYLYNAFSVAIGRT